VRQGTQVNYDGKLHGPGDTFSATEAEVAAEGIRPYVEKAPEKKAQTSSANKAQGSSPNKGR
jgi:hypothetical protein